MIIFLEYLSYLGFEEGAGERGVGVMITVLYYLQCIEEGARGRGVGVKWAHRWGYCEVLCKVYLP